MNNPTVLEIELKYLIKFIKTAENISGVNPYEILSEYMKNNFTDKQLKDFQTIYELFRAIQMTQEEPIKL